MNRLKNAWHNIVIHPITGVCWLLGFKSLGDKIHGEFEREPDPTWLTDSRIREIKHGEDAERREVLALVGEVRERRR